MKQHKAYQLILEKRTVWVKATGIVTVRSANDYQHDLEATGAAVTWGALGFGDGCAQLATESIAGD